MKVFLDTNVIVDFFGHRLPFYNDAAQIIDMALRSEIHLAVSSLSFINVAYILRKQFDHRHLYEKLLQLAQLTEISKIDSEIIRSAILKEARDFEDCVQCMSAMDVRADIILTRDKTGFANMSIRSLTPAEFIEKCYC